VSYDYAPPQATAARLLTKFGTPVKVTRGTSTVGTGHGVWATNETTIDSEQGMQTAVNSRRLQLTAMAKDAEVNDIVAVGKEKFMVTKAAITKPSTTTIYQVLEVVPYV
jgi:hypothetical protein